MKYITDSRPGERDILTPLKEGELTIVTLDGEEIFSQEAPPAGWTNELLMRIQPPGIEWGAEAYLGGEWIGSTEI